MFSKIIDFVTGLYDICRLEAGPQKLPFSTVLLALTFILYIAGRAAEEAFDRPLIEAGLLGLADVLLLVLIVAVPLWLLNLGNRIPQTLTAITAAGIVVSVVDIFLIFLLIDLPLSPDRLGRVITYLTFPLVLWRVLINATLLKFALSWHSGYAFILALVHLGMVIAVGGAMPAGVG